VVSIFEKDRQNSLKRDKTKIMPIKYRISSDLSSRYFQRRPATPQNTWKIGQTQKNGLHLGKQITLKMEIWITFRHLNKRFNVGLNKWVSLRKVDQT